MSSFSYSNNFSSSVGSVSDNNDQDSEMIFGSSSSSSSSGCVKSMYITGRLYVPCCSSNCFGDSCSNAPDGGLSIAILANYGDDTCNGQKDCSDSSGSDKDIETITFTWSGCSNHPNNSSVSATVTLEVSGADLRIWDNIDRSGTPLIDGNGSHSIPVIGTNGCLYVYAEGKEVGGGELASGTLNFTLEHPAPCQSISKLRTYRVLTPYWKGFEIPERWQTNAKMNVVKVIGNERYGDVSSGTIRTPFPDQKNNPQDLKNTKASEQGKSAKSVEAYTGNFEINVKFDLVGDEYVHAKHQTDRSPSFFRNSGIYIFGVYEIQIFDTNALLAAIGRGEVERTGNNNEYFQFVGNQNSDSIQHENKCVTAIPYGMPPTGFGQVLNVSPARYDFNDVKNWIKETGNDMTIEVERLPAKMLPNDIFKVTNLPDMQQIRVKVILNKGASNEIVTWDGTLTGATGGNNGERGDGYIWLQAHWGSGVMFTDVTITRKP